MPNWYDYTNTHDFGEKFAFATYPVQGEDIEDPFHTPITAPYAGTVAKSYYDASGGTLIVRATLPNRINVPYYYFVHMDQINVMPGQSIGQGDLLGYSGGQNSGGSHPAAPNYSSGPHIEFGESKGPEIPYTFATVPGDPYATITPDLNPDYILNYLQSGVINLPATPTNAAPAQNSDPLKYQGSCSCPSGYVQGVNGSGGKVCQQMMGPFVLSTIQCPENAQNFAQDPLQQISSFLSNLGQLETWLADPVRIIKLVAGMGLLFVALLLLINPASQMAMKVKGAFPQ